MISGPFLCFNFLLQQSEPSQAPEEISILGLKVIHIFAVLLNATKELNLSWKTEPYLELLLKLSWSRTRTEVFSLLENILKCLIILLYCRYSLKEILLCFFPKHLSLKKRLGPSTQHHLWGASLWNIRTLFRLLLLQKQQTKKISFICHLL